MKLYTRFFEGIDRDDSAGFWVDKDGKFYACTDDFSHFQKICQLLHIDASNLDAFEVEKINNADRVRIIKFARTKGFMDVYDDGEILWVRGQWAELTPVQQKSIMNYAKSRGNLSIQEDTRLTRWLEFTIPDWKTQVTDVIKRTYADRRKIKGAIEKSVQLVSFNSKIGEAQYAVEPTKKFQNTKADIVDGTAEGDTNLYTVRVMFVDWEKWIPQQEWKSLSIGDFNDFLKVCDIKWSCDCMSYHWTGLKYQQSQANSAIYKTNIPDNKWRPRHTKNGGKVPGTCKHQQAVIAKLLRYPATMLNEIKKSLRAEK